MGLGKTLQTIVYLLTVPFDQLLETTAVENEYMQRDRTNRRLFEVSTEIDKVDLDGDSDDKDFQLPVTSSSTETNTQNDPISTQRVTPTVFVLQVSRDHNSHRNPYRRLTLIFLEAEKAHNGKP